MELNGPQKTPAKSLWHVVRAVYYMVLKGLWKRSAALDLQLIFKRGKIAGGRALSGLLTAHHHHHHHHRHGKTAAFDVAAFSSAFSCRSMDTANAVYAPREVEFSCSNTPSFPYFHRKGRHQHHHHHHNHHHHRSSSRSRSSSSSSSRRDSTLYNYDAAAIAKVFDVLNSDSAASASTSGASVDVAASFARSPRRARQPLRVTDSPFSTAEEEDDDDDDDDLEEGLEVGGGGGGVDREAENFIRWFKEQLRTQTPESEYGDHWL